MNAHLHWRLLPRHQDALAPTQPVWRIDRYYGLPAISLPCGMDDNGMPVGIQLVGKPQQDAVLLRLAAAYQQATFRQVRVRTPY